MIIKEIKCKSLLNKTGLDCDYCINPYVGCSNGCVYCYARFMLRYSGHKEDWGSFVDVKVNAAEVLGKEVKKAKPGSVFISSVTDAYQSIESKYKLTRSILETLPRNFSPYILTKSALVVRDVDLLKEFKKASVGMTITSLNDWVSFEPGASPTADRIKALGLLHDSGIKTHVFLGPVLPYITDRDLDVLMDSIKFVDHVMMDRLNIKSGNWPRIKKVVEKKYPHIYDSFVKAVFEDDSYYPGFCKKLKGLRKDVEFVC